MKAGVVRADQSVKDMYKEKKRGKTKKKANKISLGEIKI